MKKDPVQTSFIRVVRSSSDSRSHKTKTKTKNVTPYLIYVILVLFQMMSFSKDSSQTQSKTSQPEKDFVPEHTQVRPKIRRSLELKRRQGYSSGADDRSILASGFVVERRSRGDLRRNRKYGERGQFSPRVLS